MSLIGTLEQFSLSHLLYRSERHKKTGLLVLKQGAQWIEIYLRDGRLLCVGPIRTNANFGERLLQDGLISPSVLKEVLLHIPERDRTESLVARTLVERGCVSREDLRTWAIAKTVDVLRVVLSWSSGEVYFDESTRPPAERLLVSMSISELLESASPVTPVPSAYQASSPVSSQSLQPPVNPAFQAPAREHTTPKSSPDVARVPTLMSASQFIDDSSFSAPSLPTSFPSTESLAPVAETPEPEQPRYISLFGESNDVVQESGPQPLQAEPVMQPVPPKRIDISFMQAEMVLWPADLSAVREQNPRVQITPHQWLVLTRVDGQTQLQQICLELNLPPEFVCQTAGELIAEGLIHISLPSQNQMQELSPVSRELAASGLSNGYVAPGYASATSSPWSASMPAIPTSDMPPPASGLPFATESQWGNGGNGATFIPGRGWITTPQPLQPLHSSGPLASPNNPYAQTGMQGY